MTENIADQILNAIDSNDKSLFDSILNSIKSTQINSKIAAELTLIIEAFLENPMKHPNRTAFITELPKYVASDFELLRTALPIAIKSLLPANMNKTTTIKVIGVKNKAVPLPKVYAKFNTLMRLKKGQFFHSNISKSWAVTGDIDWMIGTISVFDFKNSYIQDIELDSFLEKSAIFNASQEIEEIISSKHKPNKSSFIELLTLNAIDSIDMSTIKAIAMETFVPITFSLIDFNLWWENPLIKEGSSPQHHLNNFDIQNSRSIHELHYILKQNEASLKHISDEKILRHISAVLNQIKPSSKAKDFLNWAESISILMLLVPEDAIKLFAPKDILVSKLIWPTDEINDVCLNTWTQLKALALTNWISFTEKVLGQNYLKIALTLLPWKVWPAISSKLSLTFIEAIIEEANKITSAEMLLWIWKNREKLSSLTIAKLTYSVVIPAIYRSKIGALWQAGPKELRKLLLENSDFLSQIIGKDTEENIISFVEYLSNSTALTSIDRQSIIVKISRLSQKAKEIVNSDIVKKIILIKQNRSTHSSTSEMYITSYKSFNDKIKELQELINRHIPENTEAIAIARAHGDLRENAEYAAAKERQKFLNEHRAFLESRISSTQPTDFSDILVTDFVLIGSTISVTYTDKKREVFHILGAWDSIPSKKYVAYETEFGKAVIGKKIGETVTLPDGQVCTISSIEKISQQIIDELKK